MKRINAMVRAYFRQWPVLRTGALVIVIGLLIFCVVGIRNAYTTATEKEEPMAVLSYSQSGDFTYRARVTDNDLYGNATLTEQDTSVLFLGITESIEGGFTYRFESDQPVQQLLHEVEINTVVESPNNWSKTVTLVPETVETGPFTISFPIDTDGYFQLINAIEQQIRIESGSHNLTFQVSVHTTAQTDYGPINELLTQSMSCTLQSSKLTFGGGTSLSQTRYGSFQGTVTTFVDMGSTRMSWIISLAFILIVALYVVWTYVNSRPAPLPAVEKEARQARKKHEDLLVDVAMLPEDRTGSMPMTFGTQDVVIPVSSLDELVKVSESLIKPVLHKAEPNRHIYRVMDGPIIYEYVSEEPARDVENEPPDAGRATS